MIQENLKELRQCCPSIFEFVDKQITWATSSNHKNFEAGLKENQKDIVSVDQNRTKYAGKGFKGSNLVNPFQ